MVRGFSYLDQDQNRLVAKTLTLCSSWDQPIQLKEVLVRFDKPSLQPL